MFVNMNADTGIASPGGGDVGDALAQAQFEPGLMRPYFDTKTGRPCVTINSGKTRIDKKTGRLVPIKEQVPILDLVHKKGISSPVLNATTLRKDEWIQLDRAVVRVARQRLRAWSDLLAANSVGGFNAMGKSLFEWETMSDPGEAFVDMDALSEVRGDATRFQLEGVPLPITHSGFFVPERKLIISRNSGTPFDTTMAEAAGRRVAEMIEKTVIGMVTGLTYGTAADYNNTPTVWGYITHPDRNTKTDMTAPDGTNGTTVLSEWLAVRDLLYSDNMFGPYMVYTSTDYDQYLDDEFKTNSGLSLRQRLRQIDGVTDIRRLDYLTNTFTVLFVQMTQDVARAINGMPITTLQWDTKGGLQKNFKVMAIQVPQIRSDFDGRSGIAHATTS